jgi:NhaP-type Na+/H+ or K+/H+ antiporter
VAEHVSAELAGGVLFALLVLAFCLVAGLLSRWLVTAPLAFVTIGAILGFALGPVDTETFLGVKELAELTLVLILFHDAAQVRPRQIGAERGVITRLLLLGFPLTILAGYAAARLLLPDLDPMMALLLAIILAPTDAGLGAATVLNPVVPTRVRRVLNVESGINDGLATPIVLFTIAAIAGTEGLGTGASVAQGILELSIGVGAGAAVGLGCGWLLGTSRARGTSTLSSRVLALLMVPFLAYGLALVAGGNGFVAAFVSGTSFAGVSRWIHDEDPLTLAESVSDLLAAAVWLVFGMAAVPFVWRDVTGLQVVYGVLALTVLRMGPVALSLLGTGLRPPTMLFLGWFGPRGLASVIFGLIALESLLPDENLRTLLATMSVTVLASVVAHGFSAEPLAEKYGHWARRTHAPVEQGASSEPRTRRGVPAPGASAPGGRPGPGPGS